MSEQYSRTRKNRNNYSNNYSNYNVSRLVRPPRDEGFSHGSKLGRLRQIASDLRNNSFLFAFLSTMQAELHAKLEGNDLFAASLRLQSSRRSLFCSSKQFVSSKVRALAAKTRQLEVDLDIFSAPSLKPCDRSFQA